MTVSRQIPALSLRISQLVSLGPPKTQRSSRSQSVLGRPPCLPAPSWFRRLQDSRLSRGEASLFPQTAGLGASFGSFWLEPEVGAGEGGSPPNYECARSWGHRKCSDYMRGEGAVAMLADE